MHGSTMEVRAPEIRKSKFNKDFGEGFYCTSIETQAFRWATRYGNGIISYYKYDPSYNSNVLSFPEMTEEWLDFIAMCRNGGSHDYDTISGPMANDEVYNYVADFLAGVISRAAFWELVRFRYPTQQICFHTKKSLQAIQFVNSREVY